MKICVATVLSIALLLGNSVNLRASVTGPIHSDGEGPASQACPTSCQGPAVLGTILQGPKGDAGEPCQRGDRVAFTVTRTNIAFASTSGDTRLPFQKTETLLPGTSFDLGTGTFTCSVPGTYMFIFSVNKHSSSSGLSVYLRKNGDRIVTGYTNDSGHQEQVSGSAMLVLLREDTVYLTMYGTAYSGLYHYTSFSGFLLYPE